MKCRKCGRELETAFARYLQCAPCKALEEPTYKRCSRCGLHQRWPMPGWGSTHCPPCHRLDASESRARRKERLKSNPPPPVKPHMRQCTKCGAEHLYPTSGWRDRTCPPCSRGYQRLFKKSHPPKTAPDVRVDQAQFKKCSHCRQRVLYHPREQWKGDICGRCHEVFGKRAKANRKAKVEQWKQNATPVECRTCGETSAYRAGWDWTQCPGCVSERAKAAYAKVKASPERLAHRNKVQAAAEVKRAVKRNKERLERPPGPDSSPPSPTGDTQGD